ncbi:MAG: type I-MYXAN CRISPR-associated protein Cmx8, partial [Planktothrix sp.]
VPQGAFLSDFDQSSDDPEQKIWLKLWRDMLWNIIRGVPTTRNPFKLRVNGQSYSKDTEQIWKELQNPEKLTGQTGQYFLGAMASNPENIPIKDQVKYQFLLHFWPFVAQVYCPTILDKDGKRDIAGYVLAIPDIAHLKNFCRVFFKVLEARNSKLWRYLPLEAVIDLPQEGALDLLRLLRDRISQEIGDQQIRRTILGVEIIHAEKVGKSGVKIRSISYVEPILTQIDRYQDIIKNYWCPWFRKQRLLNLINSLPESDAPDAPLAELPPWTEFDALLSRIPRKWLEDPYFSHDARQLFEQEVNVKMKKEIRDYAQIVYQVCQSYVLGKLSSKDGLEWDKCKGNPKLEDEYNKKKHKIANEAFLATRSRTESQAFIDYFVSTLYPFVRKEEFTDFAEALFHKTDEIRSLTLLALSSQFPLKRSEKDQKSGV